MKSLIAITTCNRLPEVQKYIWNYLSFVNKNDDFHFLLALDGKESSYLDFCEQYDIPLIYSKEREGVGLSKNRVLTQFPNYTYYFFIEDDVELLNPHIFKNIIQLSKATRYGHFCGRLDSIDSEEKTDDTTIQLSTKGGAQFQFYTKKTIDEIGGWHTLFSKYKRYGHTEHSFRVFFKNLQPAPFIFSDKFSDFIMIHNPPSVTNNDTVKINKEELIEEEQTLIDTKNIYFPILTLSKFYFNNKEMGYNAKVDKFLNENPQHYPLTKGTERKKALGEYYALMINRKNNTFFKNFTLAIKSMWLAPMNNELKHKIKHYFK